MHAHRDLTGAFRAGIDSGALPPGLTATAPDESARRFDVYRNNVVHSLTEALRTRFPVVERLLGAEFFRAMARLFLAQHPPRGPVLQEWGDEMPGFVEGFAPLAQLPWIADVARLELARGAAYHAADAVPTSRARIAQTAAEAAEQARDLRITLHPTVRLLRSRWPVLAVWMANQPGVTPGPMPEGPDHLLIARDPDLRVFVQRLDPATHALLSALAAGTGLVAAQARSAPDCDTAAALAMLIGAGLIADIQTGDILP